MPEESTYEELNLRILELEKSDLKRKQAEYALRESEERFRRFFMNAPLPYQSLDASGNIIDVNSTFLEAIGYSREEVIGKNFGDFLHPDWVAHFKENFPAFKAVGEVLGVEFEMVKKDGSTILVSFNGKIQRDDQNRFERTHCIFQDITARKQAEGALLTKTRILENVFESAPYIMMLVTEEGRVTDINRSGVRFTGRSKDELLGLLGGEVFGCLNSYDGRGCGKNDVCKFCPVRSRVNHTFETGEPVYEGRGQLVVLSGGVSISLEILVSTTPVPSAEGRQVLVTIVDITDRIRAEEAIIEREKYLRTILQATEDGFFVFNIEGKFTETNDAYCCMCGYTRDEFLKLDISCIDTVEHPTETAARIQRIVSNGSETFETRHRRKDGSVFDVEISVSYMNTKGGLFVCFCRDITERKIRENEHELTVRLIAQINTPGNFSERILDLAASLKGWSGCEAVGIRLRDGDDYPYYQTLGFPSAFILAEKHLCAYGPDGKIFRDGTGNPVLECMCGNVLCGRIDPSKPFFTSHGSFWTNSTTALLTSATEADRQAPTRNRCNGMGYESVALIPLRTGDHVFGLLQFNDHRPNRFTPTLIADFERMADSLAMALLQRKAVEALRVSEERFSSIAFSIPGAIYQFVRRKDGVFEIPFMSEGAVSLLEKPMAELQDATLLFEDVHPDDVAGMWSSIAESASSLTRWERELRIVLKTGTIKWLRGVSSPTALPDGSICWNGVLLDISDRKKSELALRKSEEIFRTLSVLAPSGIYLCSPNGHCQYANPRWCEMAGLSLEDALDDGWINGLHPEDRDLVFSNWQKMVASEGQWGFEYRFQTPAGKVTWVYGLAAPHRDAMGNIVSYIGINTDITERKRTEETLIASEERLRTILQTAMDGFWLVDMQGRLLEVNETYCQMSGYNAQELLSMSIFDLEAVETADDTAAHIRNVMAQGEHRFESRHRRKNGSIFNVEVSVQFQPTEGGRLVAFLRDITERKKAEEEKARLMTRLQQAQKMEAIGLLAGGIAHDLNNILFPICGLSEMLLDELPAGNSEYESIEQIHKSAIRGSELVKQILAFSRQSKPQKLPIRIQSVLKEALKLIQSTIPANINIKSHINSDCGLVSADPTQLHQIAMNLITNAYHAVERKGGTIDIELKETVFEKDDLYDILMKPGKYACITISDTGIGIDHTLIDKIFDPYFTTKEQGKGTGLGLSVVHGIVKEHGGDIRVYSEDGKGTAFHVYLPLLEDARNIKAAADSKKHPTGSESILLVDDEEPIAKMMQMMLERLGYQVTVRTSSPDALDAFRASPSKFDMVISDRGMPNMTGEQLVRELILIKPEIPIILCTGFCDENDEKRAKSMGIKGILKKPVATGDLAEMVRKVLDESTCSTQK